MTHLCDTGCGRPVDNANVCTHCSWTLEQALGDVTALDGLHLAEELHTTLTRQRAAPVAGGGGASRERPLPFRYDASEVLFVLRNTLGTWVRLVAEERERDDLPDDTPAAMSGWLLGEVEWLRHHEAGAEAVDEITYAVDQVRRVVDRPPDAWYAGPCDLQYQVCDEELYARVGSPFVRCPTCGETWDVKQRRGQLLEAARDRLATASEAARAIVVWSEYDRGENRLVRRIDAWRERRRIEVKQHIWQGERRLALYRIGDILDLLAGELAAEAKEQAS